MANTFLAVLGVIVVSSFTHQAYADEAEVAGYTIRYTAPTGSSELDKSDPRVVATWVVPEQTIRILIGASAAPAKSKPRESDLKDALDEMLGQPSNPFQDQAAAYHVFLENYSPFAIDGLWLYSAMWWDDGIFLKVQGSYQGGDPDAALVYFREYLDHIEVVNTSTGQPASSGRYSGQVITNNKKPKDDYPVEFTGKIVLAGFVGLMIAGGVVFIKKKSTTKKIVVEQSDGDKLIVF